MEENLCNGCGRDFDELYGKGLYNENLDSGMYCKKCFLEAFGEPIEMENSDE